MQQKIIVVFVLLMSLASLTAEAQDLVSGNWKLTKVEDQGIINEVNTEFTFSKEGKIMERGREFGQWEIKPNKKEIVLKSSFSEDEFNGTHKISKLTKKEFIFSKKQMRYFFKKIDLKAISKGNKKSKLMGTWKLNHKDFDDLFLILKLPNNFIFVSASPNSVSSEKGTWEYLRKTKELSLQGTRGILKGKSRVKDVSDNFLALIRPQETLFFDNVNFDKNPIQWLDFKSEDLMSEENQQENQQQNNQENEAEKLPKAWRNQQNFNENLANFKSLEYKYATYVKEAEAFRFSKICKNITINKEEQSVSIANKLITKYDTIQTSENYKGNMVNRYNSFFPEKTPDYYKIIGKETINNQNCTVVIGVLGDEKIKYWMIDNSPGVYAKIIKQTTDTFFNETTYTIETLTKSIKK
ncbi:META domain-containing protein [Tenacibaculum piscium]|uniref:META domain-containing protein n=1 Tax=Tenacibaculum piscium TaxID=1458515 RepID=UPI001F185810|nr:META domain-containing protein [Tenacibaculum piscium]